MQYSEPLAFLVERPYPARHSYVCVLSTSDTGKSNLPVCSAGMLASFGGDAAVARFQGKGMTRTNQKGGRTRQDVEQRPQQRHHRRSESQSSKYRSDKQAAASQELVDGVPAFLFSALVEQYGQELASQIVAGFVPQRLTSLRVNTLKADVSGVCAALDEAGIAWEPVQWSDVALVLPQASAKDVQALAIFEQGLVYLQNLSSQLPPLVMDPQPATDILDMAAAPGGKTTQLVAMTGGAARVTACEMHGARYEKMLHNLRVQGAGGVGTLNIDARRLDDMLSFDQVLLDAPCSGSGTVRVGDPRMPQRLTSVLVQRCAKTQRALLAKALKLVKPGGTVLYSTCSVLREENEGVLADVLPGSGCVLEPIDLTALGLDGLPLLPSSMPGTVCIKPTQRYEGFFVSLVRNPR